MTPPFRVLLCSAVLGCLSACQCGVGILRYSEDGGPSMSGADSGTGTSKVDAGTGQPPKDAGQPMMDECVVDPDCGPNLVCDNGLCKEPVTTCASDQTSCWKASPWGRCSGGECTTTGVRTRTVSCIDSSGAPSTACKTTAPVSSEACELTTDCLYVWKTSEFSTCKAACGPSTQTRTVQCKRNDGLSVAESLCPSPKPDLSQPCQSSATCPPYTWVTTTGACSNTCGAGKQAQTATCHRVSDDSVVSNAQCANLTKPPAEGPCRGCSSCGPTSTLTFTLVLGDIGTPNVDINSVAVKVGATQIIADDPGMRAAASFAELVPLVSAKLAVDSSLTVTALPNGFVVSDAQGRVFSETYDLGKGTWVEMNVSNASTQLNLDYLPSATGCMTTSP